MKIGTWNLEQKWTKDHAGLIAKQKRGVWLLTEVCNQTVESLKLDGWNCRYSEGYMAPGIYWSAVASRDDMAPAPLQAHSASVAASVFSRHGSAVTPKVLGTPQVQNTHTRHKRALEEVQRRSDDSYVYGASLQFSFSPSGPAGHAYAIVLSRLTHVE